MDFNELDALFSGGGSPAAKFGNIGDSISGVITQAEARQQTDFDTGEGLVWDDGKPRMEVVLTLTTSLRDDSIEDDDGMRRVFCRGQMLTALRNAVKKTNDRGPRPGARVSITYSGNGEAKRKGLNAPKLYDVIYEASNDVAVAAVFEEPAEETNQSVEDLIKDMDPAEIAALLKKK
jgi:hypothetical protein